MTYSLSLVLTSALLWSMSAGDLRMRLTDGDITYVGKDGRKAKVVLSKKCADLWVAPDQGIIAFVAIDKSRSTPSQGSEPFIEETSVYIALRANDFTPVQLITEVSLGDRIWKTFRQPSVSPDRKTIYFSIPYTMTSWKLMRSTIPPTAVEAIGDADGYCVIWGGDHSGELLLQSRREPDEMHPEGVRYPCYLRDREGKLTAIAGDDACWSFDAFAARWSKNHGGSCAAWTLSAH